MRSGDRKLGIDVVDALPWGMHICYFYHTKQDLIDVLVPYFQAGLENNEYCIWITSKPLSAEEALMKAVPDSARYLANQQIEIIPHTEWYLKDGTFDRERVLHACLEKLQRALASGFDGMRITGDTVWIERKDWSKFIEYEEEVNSIIGKHPILALCTYPVHRYGASQVIDVERNHHFSLIKHEGKLALIGSSEREPVEEALQESEEFSSNLLVNSPHPIIIINPDTSVRYANPSLERLTGFSSEELIGRKAPYPWWTQETLQSTRRDFAKAIHQGAVRLEELFQKKNGERFWVEISSMPIKREGVLKYCWSSWIDITEHKQMEESHGMPLSNKAGRPLIKLQERFIRYGFEELGDQEIIELLLSMVLPIQKAKHLAEACMERFKNLRDFLAALPEELQQIGITPTCMFCIKLMHELPVKVLQQRIVTRSIYKSSKEVFDYLYYSMRDLKTEVFKVIYLNSRSQIIDTVDLFEGTADSIPIRPREIIESAITHSASALIFVHNHPTGDPNPSKTDKQLTRDLVFVGEILQIKLLDHIIIGADSYFSFADDGLIQKYEDNFLNLKIRGVLASIPLHQHYKHLSKGLFHQHPSKLFTKHPPNSPDREDISSSPVLR